MIRRIVGASMEPTLQQRQVIVTRKKPITLGDIVIANCDRREVVKRVVNVSGSVYELAGDNPRSARYQNVPESDILGVIIWPKQKYR